MKNYLIALSLTGTMIGNSAFADCRVKSVDMEQALVDRLIKQKYTLVGPHENANYSIEFNDHVIKVNQQSIRSRIKYELLGPKSETVALGSSTYTEFTAPEATWPDIGRSRFRAYKKSFKALLRDIPVCSH